MGTGVSTLAVGMNNYAAPVQVLAAGQKNGWWFVVCDLLSHSQTTPRFCFTSLRENVGRAWKRDYYSASVTHCMEGKWMEIVKINR